MCIVPIAFEFQLHGGFQTGNLEKTITSREHLKFFMVNSKEIGKTNNISLSEDLIIDVKAHNKHGISVLKPYLFVIACLLIELHWKLKVCCLQFFFFFFKIGASKLGVQLIYGFGL